MSASSILSNDVLANKSSKTNVNISQNHTQSSSNAVYISDEESSDFKSTLQDTLCCSEDESCQCDLTVTNETEDTHEDELHAEESRVRKNNLRNYNKTFNENTIREMERTNAILMNKILSNSLRQTQYPTVNVPVIRNTSNSINRRRRQQEIDRNNLLLLKRIQSVKPFGLSRRSN